MDFTQQVEARVWCGFIRPLFGWRRGACNPQQRNYSERTIEVLTQKTSDM